MIWRPSERSEQPKDRTHEQERFPSEIPDFPVVNYSSRIKLIGGWSATI